MESGDKDRLAQNDRVSDQCFEPDEELYRRVMEVHLIGGILSPLAFESKPQSVNRGKYSRPMDVVHPACCDGHDRSDWLVAVLLVEDVRRSYRLEDGRVFVLFPKHTPKPSCYPHSEVWCNRQQERRTHIRSLRKAFADRSDWTFRRRQGCCPTRQMVYKRIEPN